MIFKKRKSIFDREYSDVHKIFISLCETDEDAACEIIYSGRIDPTYDDNSAIKVASRIGNAKVIKALLTRQNVNPAVENNIPLIVACKYNHLECVKILLDDSRVFRNLDFTHLFESIKRYINVCAAALSVLVSHPLVYMPSSYFDMIIKDSFKDITYNKPSIIALLKYHKFNPNDRGYEFLKDCILIQDFEIFSIILNMPKFDISGQDNTVFERAAKTGSFEHVKLIITHKNFSITPNQLEYIHRLVAHKEELNMNIVEGLRPVIRTISFTLTRKLLEFYKYQYEDFTKLSKSELDIYMNFI